MWTTVEVKCSKKYNQVLWHKRDMRAKERRALVSSVCGSWMKDNGLKLGRDYKVYSRQTHRTENHDFLIFELKDPSKAVLFKLTWG